jgi:hypothetical protein
MFETQIEKVSATELGTVPNRKLNSTFTQRSQVFSSSACIDILDSCMYKLAEVSAWGVWLIDIGTGTKVPLRFVTYLSKVTKINEKKCVDPVTASSLVKTFWVMYNIVPTFQLLL